MNAPLRPTLDQAHPLDLAPLAVEEAPARRRRWPWALLVLAAAAAGGYAYQTRFAADPVTAPEAAPAEIVMRLSPLEVSSVAATRLRETVRVSGSLAPGRQATLTAQTGGRVETISVQPGEAVAQGAVIAQIDTAGILTQIAQQQAAIAATQAQLDLAERQLASNRSLAERGIAATLTLESAQSSANALRANLAAQEAELDGIRLSLDHATIRAPFSGIVSARSVDPGQTVGAGATVATMVDLTEIEARVLAPLSAAALLAVGQPAELAVEGFRDRLFEAEVSRISPVAAEGTRAIPIYLAMANADTTLRGGMFVAGDLIVSARADAIALPAGALRRDEGGDYVLGIADGRLMRRPVILGPEWNDGRLIEIAEGLAAGDTIVVAPLAELQPGMAVEIEG